MPRFTVREPENIGGFTIMDGERTIEGPEVLAEALNLLDRIAVALEEKGKPGETLRRTRREVLEESIGRCEASLVILAGLDGEDERRAHVEQIRAELTRLESGEG